MTPYQAIDLHYAALRHAEYYRQQLTVLRDLFEHQPQQAMQRLEKLLPQIRQAYVWLKNGAMSDAALADLLVEFVYLSVDRISRIVAPSEWEEWVDSAIAMAGQVTRQVEFTLEKSRLAFRRGDMMAALEIMEATMPLVQQTDQLALRGRAYYQLGLIHQKRGKMTDAQSAMQQAMQAYIQAEDDNGIGRVNSFMAQAAIDAGEYDRAKTLLLQTIDHWRQAGDEYRIAVEQYQLGLILTNRKAHDEAMRYLQPARQTFHRLNVRRYEAFCLQLIAAIYMDWEQPDEALTFIQRAYDLFQQVQDQRGIATLLTAFGDAHKLMGHPERAIHYYEQAVKVATAINYAFHMAEGNRGIGCVLADQSRWEQAREYLCRAFYVASDSGVQLLALQALVSFIPVLIHDGDIVKASDYIAFLKDATTEALILDQIPALPHPVQQKPRALDLHTIHEEIHALYG